MRWLSKCAAVALIPTFVAAVPVLADGPGPAANDIAERFAADAEKSARRAAEQQRQRRLESEMKRNESDMLERARAEAAAREAAEREAQQVAQREAEARRVAELRRIEEAKRQEEAQQLALRQEQARQEAERVAAAERQAIEERKRIEAARLAEVERAKADADRLKAEAETARLDSMARDRAAEAERVSQALREAREAHERRQQARQQQETDRLREPAPRDATLDQRAAPPPSLGPTAVETVDPTEPGNRFAVLLVMEPGNRGIRRHNKTADPLLCLEQGCYVSSGPDQAASLLRQRKAFGIGRTLGERAGACGNSLGCVFRDVEIGSFPSFVQPVDMRLIRHDRREVQQVEGGSDCYLAAGRLGCRRAIRSDSYVMWLVPEKMARAIGPELLEQAVAQGLAETEHVQPTGIWRR